MPLVCALGISRPYVDGTTAAAATAGRRLWRSHDDHIKTPQRICLGATNPPTGHVIRRRGAVYDRNKASLMPLVA